MNADEAAAAAAATAAAAAVAAVTAIDAFGVGEPLAATALLDVDDPSGDSA